MSKLEDLFILECENAVAQGVKRPGLVDLAYAKVISEWKETLTSSDQRGLDILKVLVEAEMNWMLSQRQVLDSLLSHSIVIRWLEKTGPDYHDLNLTQQTLAILQRLNTLGTLEEGRELFKKSGKVIDGKGPNTRDIDNPIVFEKEFKKICLIALLKDTEADHAPN